MFIKGGEGHADGITDKLVPVPPPFPDTQTNPSGMSVESNTAVQIKRPGHFASFFYHHLVFRALELTSSLSAVVGFKTCLKFSLDYT